VSWAEPDTIRNKLTRVESKDGQTMNMKRKKVTRAEMNLGKQT
jgi:hypothetical protein